MRVGKGKTSAELQGLRFSGVLEEDIALMRDIMGLDDTIVYRRFENRFDKKIRGWRSCC